MKKKTFLKGLSLFLVATLQCAGVISPVSATDTTVSSESGNEIVEISMTKELQFRDYQNGIVSGRNTGTLSNYDFDSKPVLKIVPNIYSDRPILTIDGWNYARAEIALDKYKWMAVEYYYESKDPLVCQMNVGIMSSGILDTSIYKYSENSIVPNMWDFAIFDISGAAAHLVPGCDNYNIRQLHLEPFGNKYPLSERAESDVMYIGKLMFFTEKPSFGTHNGYMNGYDDGNFKPSGTMTRAEACTVTARLLEKEENISGNCTYSDVSDDDWFSKYVGYCEQKGLLKAFDGSEFEPQKAITRSEFAQLVYLTGLSETKDTDIIFTDVDESHKYYDSIMAAAGAGLINGYEDGSFAPDKTVTRAEVVTIINRATNTSKTIEDIPQDITILFLDVDETHWAFADIAEACVDHTYWDNQWMYVFEDPVEELMKKVDPNLVLDFEGGLEKISELDELEKTRVDEIRKTTDVSVKIYGAKFYVSADGDDKNDGRSEAKAVRTLARANELAQSSDAVLLRRGDIFRERFTAKSGVTYSAYGSGEKPRIYGSPENGADAEKWSLVYKGDDGALIWKYANEKMKDVGSIIFNDGDGYAIKEIPSSKKTQFIVRGSESDQYLYTEQLDRNFEFFHGANSVIVGSYIDPSASVGPLYLRCDNGNPGVVFDSIEFAENGHLVRVGGSNVTIDNLCLMYGGSHAIASNAVNNLNVSNCEIGFIGGSIQGYGSGGRGMALRYGNGIEVYGGVDDYNVDNCYIYQCYDAGVTHQFSGGSGSVLMNNIKYTDNVITDCVYSIEYFLDVGNASKGIVRGGNNHLISGNLMRRAGFGFGSTRTDTGVQRHIRSGSVGNLFENVQITNNIFDRSVYELFQTVISDREKAAPCFDGNTYIQGYKNKLFAYGSGTVTNSYTGASAEKNIKNTVGDKTGVFYIVPNIGDYSYNYTIDKKDANTYNLVEDDMTRFEERPEELIPPYFVRAAKNANVYVSASASVSVEQGIDDTENYRFVRLTPKNNSSRMMIDCYGLSPSIPLASGQSFIKILLRTNHSSIIHLNMYGITDSSGNAASGGALYLQSRTKTIGNGEWEEIIIPATNINSAYAASNQVQIFFFENITTGSDFYEDGKLKDNVYCDIAGWGVFENYTSAEQISLVDYVK